MARKYKVPVDAAEAQRIEDDLWEAYYAEEIAKRGLRDGDSLDTDLQGRRVPMVTTRYVTRTRVPGRPGGVLELDDWAQAANGRVVRVRGGGTRTVKTDDCVDGRDLPADVKALLDPDNTFATASVPIPVAGKKPKSSVRDVVRETIRAVFTRAEPPPETPPAPVQEPAQPAPIEPPAEPEVSAAPTPEPPAKPATIEVPEPPFEIPRIYWPTRAAVALAVLAGAAIALARHCG